VWHLPPACAADGTEIRLHERGDLVARDVALALVRGRAHVHESAAGLEQLEHRRCDERLVQPVEGLCEGRDPERSEAGRQIFRPHLQEARVRG